MNITQKIESFQMINTNPTIYTSLNIMFDPLESHTCFLVEMLNII